MSTATYLISRPGRPLHLAIWANDQRPAGARFTTGRYVPICGQDRGRKMQATGPWHPDWAKHIAHHGRGPGYICARCRETAKDLYSGMLIELSEACDG